MRRQIMERGIRPDANESASQRERYDAAQADFGEHRDRIDTATNSFQYSRQEFHALEEEFLALVEGLRIRLLTSFDNAYRHAVNELADAMLASIGQNRDSPSIPDVASDGRTT